MSQGSHGHTRYVYCSVISVADIALIDCEYQDVGDTLRKGTTQAWPVPRMCCASLRSSELLDYCKHIRDVLLRKSRNDPTTRMSPSSNSSELFFRSGCGREWAYGGLSPCLAPQAAVRVFTSVDPSRVVNMHMQSQLARTLRSMLRSWILGV